MEKTKKLRILKTIILVVGTLVSLFCFMIKLPVPFRGIDTSLHALFFFLASAFINLLFGVKTIKTHLLIFGMLFLFGTLIEFAQEYSNTLVRKRIHGNFDPQDLKFNLMGLSFFSLIWFSYYIIGKLIRK